MSWKTVTSTGAICRIARAARTLQDQNGVAVLWSVPRRRDAITPILSVMTPIVRMLLPSTSAAATEGRVRHVPGLAVPAVPAVPAGRRPAGGDRRPGRGDPRRAGVPDAARRHRLRQDLHDGQRDRPAGSAGDRVCTQQDAGGPALQRVPGVLSEKCCGVLCQLLRLLPARGLCPSARPVHREGQRDQRAHRADAPFGDEEPAGAARRGDRRPRCRRSTASARPSDYHRDA